VTTAYKEFWDTIKKPNLKIHLVKEEAEIQIKGIGNPFSEIIAENFPCLCNNVDTHVQEAFQIPNRYDQKRTTQQNIIIKMPKLENEESYKRKAPAYIEGKCTRITSDLSNKL
jgi:hypothetical protein